MQDLVSIIENAFDKRADIKSDQSTDIRDAVSEANNL